jgi:signal transduction histidine kinase
MSITVEEPTVPDPGDLRRVACAPMGGNAHWALVWHALFFGTLSLAVILAVAGGADDPTRFEYVGATVALTVAWYVVWAVLARRLTARSGLAAGIYVGGLIVLWLALVLQEDEFTLLTPSVFVHIFGYLPWSAALPVSLAAAGIMIVPDIRDVGGLRTGHLVSPALVFVVAVLVARSFQTISVQSEERRRLLEELQATRAELAETEREAVRLAERQRLAGEIHDTLTQGFASIVMLLEAASASLEARKPDAGEHVRRALATARENLLEARRLVWSMRPEALADGELAEALERTGVKVAARSSLSVRTTVTGSPRRLGPEIEVTLLRAAQEGLRNVERHAQATEAHVELVYSAEATILRVADDGRGFDPTKAGEPRPSGGVGLVAMRERVEQLGGSLSVESAPGRGTTLTAEIPVPDDLPTVQPRAGVEAPVS